MEKKKRNSFRAIVWGSIFGVYGLVFLLGFAILFFANIWYSLDGIQAKLMTKGHSVTSVVSTDRNFFDYSKITVIEDSQEKSYLIDTNIIAFYTLYPVE